MTTAPVSPLDPTDRPEPPVVVARIRSTIDDLGERARSAAAQMRDGREPAYRLMQAERAIATYEAIALVRDVLDVAEQELPPA